MKKYHSSASILKSNRDIKAVNSPREITLPSTFREVNFNQTEQLIDPQDPSKSIEFSLPKISRLNDQITKAELEASQFSVTLKRNKTNTSLAQELKIRQSYGPIYKNLFNPHHKKLMSNLHKIKYHHDSQKEPSEQGILKDMKDFKSPVSPRELVAIVPKQLAITNQSENEHRKEENSKDQPAIADEDPKAIMNDETDIDKFFITDAKNESTMKLDDTLLRKSKLHDETIIRGGNLSLFESQILQKSTDYKKIKQKLNLLASDTMFFDTVSIIDEIHNSLDLMKAMNDIKSKRDESVISHLLIQELLDRKLKIEDYIDVEKIKELTRENKLYRGVTISHKNFELIDNLCKEEFNIIEELNKDLSKPYFEKWKNFYKRT